MIDVIKQRTILLVRYNITSAFVISRRFPMLHTFLQTRNGLQRNLSGGNSKKSTGGKPASEGREMTPAEIAQASASNTAVAATMAINHTLILVLLMWWRPRSLFFFPPGLSVRKSYLRKKSTCCDAVHAVLGIFNSIN